ncbi:MAG: helical backbone metal receptor, partial [Alphaproteobacteria bacterium]|nr:helical backbone metal receptor [Alphaproteobacteria bacterium]
MSNSPRIISLVPSLTETLFDLDLQDQLVGRTSFCIHPHDKIASIPSVGGTKAIKMQKFKDLAPTHVLVNVDENPKSLAEDIEALGVEVVVTHPLTPEDNLPLFRLLG